MKEFLKDSGREVLLAGPNSTVDIRPTFFKLLGGAGYVCDGQSWIWPLDEPGTPTTLNEQCSGYNMTGVNLTATTPLIGAQAQDGTASGRGYVATAAVGIAGGMTVDIWARSYPSTGTGYFLGTGGDSPATCGTAGSRVLSVVRNGAAIAITSGGAFKCSWTDDGTAFGNSNWHHIGATWDGTNAANAMKIFVDGVQRGSCAAPGYVATTMSGSANCRITIGANVITNNLFGQGVYDQGRVSLVPRDATWFADQYAKGIDTSAPIVSQVTPVPSLTNDTTPNYTFSSTQAGTITYGGGCASATASASAGNNTITYNALANGTYSACTIRVTDTSGNLSNVLTVNTFTVDTVAPTISQVTPVPTLTNDTTPNYTFTTNQAGTIVYGGDCSSSTTAAVVGNNTVTFNALSQGTHSNCTIRVQDPATNLSNILAVNTFTVDSVAPTVTGVTSSTADGSYGTGAVIPIEVNFSEAVTVTGTPRINLSTGTPTSTFINYSSGSGTSTLVFNYTVVAGNSNADLDYASAAALGLNGGTIRDAAANDATLTLAAPGAAGSLGANKNIVISTAYPVPTTTSISPTTKNMGDAGFTLTVNGTNFVSGQSVVRIDGTNRVTTFVNSTQVTAAILAGDIATAGDKSITVFNPTPGGGESNAQTLTVIDPLATSCPTSGNDVTISVPCIYAVGTYTFTGTLTIDAVVTINSNYPSVGQVVINSDNITVTTDGTFNGNNKGYALGMGPGGADLAEYMGGTHGGKGGSNPDAEYDSVLTPSMAGSGAGHGSPGGGAIKLHANNAMVIDGDVLMQSVAVGGCAYSGGGGGAVWIETQSLSGSGLVSANGGNGQTCGGGSPQGGGGGRVAVYYTSGTPAISFTAFGGTRQFAGDEPGSAGTVYINGPTSALGSLVMDNNGSAGSQFTNLPNAEMSYDTLSLSDGAYLEVTSGQTLDVSSTPNFTGTGVRSHLFVSAGGTFNPGSSSLSLNNVDLTNFGTIGGALNDVVIATAALTEGGASFPSLASLTVNSGASFVSATDDAHSITTVDVNTGGTLTHLPFVSADATLYLITDTFTVDAGGSVNVNAKGFPASFGPGAGGDTTSPGGNGAGGAGHGGVGGDGSVAAGGGVYDSAAAPVELGSGGGSYGATLGGAGGGAVRISGNVITVNGSIVANGAGATNNYAGGGSGGSIWLQVPGGELAGSGSITVNGGGTSNAQGGCGAGGYITFEYLTKTHSGLTQANGGTAGCTNDGGTGVISDSPAEPTISTISPTSAIAGGAGFTLTVNGSNFLASSVVEFDGSPRVTTFVHAGQVTAAITAGDIATAGTHSITVTNGAPGGGTSNGVTFTVNNPLPTTTGLSPANITEDAGPFTLTVNGTNFVTTSVVRWEGAGLTTTYVSATELTAAVPGGNITTPGDFDVTVFNPAPGGGESNAQTFTVDVAGAPVPVISELTPDSATAGGPGFVLIVDGSDFVVNSEVHWNGALRPTTFVNATQLTAAINAGDIALAGIVAVTVFTPAPGGGTSGDLSFTINNPLPTTTSISPDSATAGDAAFTLTVNGTNFIDGSVVRWEGSARATTFVSDTEITAEIPGTDLATAGEYDVTVFTAGPGGGESNAQTFSVNGIGPGGLAIVDISPSSAEVGDAGFVLTVNGNGFTPSSIVQWDGDSRPTTFVNGNQITAAISSSDIETAGTVDVSVLNPGFGGGSSNSVTFTVNNPDPTTTAISPTSKTAGDGDFTLTVSGTGFVSTSVVRWDGSDRATTYLSPTELTAVITAADIDTAGTVDVTVFSPALGGGESNAQTFTINNPLPTTSGLSPSSRAANGPGFMLTVNGTNFVSTSVVRWDGSDRLTTFVSDTELMAGIEASDIVTPGTFNVTVFNPAPGGGESSAQTFTVSAIGPGGLTTTSISPSEADLDSAGFTMTVSGEGFIPSSVVQWDGSDRVTTFVSDTQLTAEIPSTDLDAVGTFAVTVLNAGPDGGSSNAQNFQVNYPMPVTTSIVPDNRTTADGDFILTVNGSGFVPVSVVRNGGSDRATTYVNNNQLTAEITSADLATAGTFSITVFNPGPGGGESNAQTFTVNNTTPSVVQLTPSSATAGGPAFTMTVDGSGFVPTSSVRWEGSVRTTVYINATQVTAEITAADIMTAGIFSVTVSNPGPGGGAPAGLNFTVNNPIPTTTSLAPSTATRNSGGFTMTVNGFDFVDESVVRWEGADLTTAFVSSTVLEAQVPGGNLSTAGSFDVTVFNDIPGGGVSNAQTFTVTPAPGGGGGGSAPPAPSAPIAGTPSVVNGTTIRWPFTDTANNETGFEIVDLGNSLNPVATTRPNDTTNLTFLDETGLTPGATYCNRAATAFSSNGQSTIGPNQTYPCVTLPAVTEPGEQPPLSVADTTLDSVTLRFSAQYENTTTTELVAIRERNTGLYVAPATQTAALDSSRMIAWVSSTTAGMHGPATTSRLLAGEQLYQLQSAPYYQTMSVWPVTVQITSLSPNTEYDFELFEKTSPDAPGVRVYHVVARTDTEFVEFEITKIYTGGQTVGNVAVLSYQITIRQIGNVPAHNVVLEDLIPYGVSYHPGSMTSDGVAQTDAVDADVAEYDTADNGIARWKWATFDNGTQHVVTVKIDNEGGDGSDVINTATATCSDATCEKYGCGDGVKQVNEVCDAGVSNGTTSGSCNNRCSGIISCGDGRREGPEFCDGNRIEGDKLWRCNACAGWSKCGNGTVETGETCDDGAATGQVGRCNNSCNGIVGANEPPVRPQVCGNSTIEAPEVCDGNRIVGEKLWRCNASCTQVSKCGNGAVEAGESCDDGAQTGTAEHCNNSCDGIVPFCGNTLVEAGEQCDAGAQSRGGTNGLPNNCSATCSACGDGIKNFAEACDSGSGAGKIGACNASCTNIIVCGDSKVEGEEICEENRVVGEKLWRCNACLGWSKCGNDIVEEGETCDDGAQTGEPGACNNSCNGTVPVPVNNCGNGATDEGEACDSGANNGKIGSCNNQCTGLIACGDGKREGEEVCEENRVDGAGRLWRCNACLGYSKCGNSIVEEGESCDEGPTLTGTPEHCNNSCDGIVPFCGNFTVEGNEQCDAGLQSRGGTNGRPDSCTATCSACGDATTNFTEFCDEGTTVNGKIDHCNPQCSGIIRCGDGKIEGEEICEQDKIGSDNNLWRCNACLGWAICGDGVVTPGLESCDDARRNGQQGRCNRSCNGVVPICGDGIVEAPTESCDDGDSNGRAGSCNAVCTGQTPYLPDSWLIQLRGNNVTKTVIVEPPAEESTDMGGEGVEPGSEGEGSSEGNGEDAVIDMGDGSDSGDTQTVTTDDPAPTITGYAAPGSYVLLYVDGELAGATTADDQGRYEFTLREPLTVGTHQIETVIVPEAVKNLPATVSVVTAGIAVVTALSMAGLVNSVGFMLFMFTQPALLFDRKKRRPYGVVFNSLSRVPVDLAIVRLYDVATDRVVQTKVTDPKGRYNFLAKAGEYRVVVTKNGYVFPSVYLHSIGTDIEYADVLTVPQFRIDQDGLVAKSLPVDPVEKEETPGAIQLRRAARALREGVAVSSTLIAIVAFLLDPSRLTLSMMLLQIALYILVVIIMLRRRPKSFGVVRDEAGQPVTGAVIRIFETRFNKLLETQISDSRGRYAFIAGKGKYFLTAAKPGYDQTTSPIVDQTVDERGLVAPNLTLKEGKKPE